MSVLHTAFYASLTCSPSRLDLLTCGDEEPPLCDRVIFVLWYTRYHCVSSSVLHARSTLLDSREFCEQCHIGQNDGILPLDHCK